MSGSLRKGHQHEQDQTGVRAGAPYRYPAAAEPARHRRVRDGVRRARAHRAAVPLDRAQPLGGRRSRAVRRDRHPRGVRPADGGGADGGARCRAGEHRAGRVRCAQGLDGRRPGPAGQGAVGSGVRRADARRREGAAVVREGLPRDRRPAQRARCVPRVLHPGRRRRAAAGVVPLHDGQGPHRLGRGGDAAHPRGLRGGRLLRLRADQSGPDPRAQAGVRAVPRRRRRSAPARAGARRRRSVPPRGAGRDEPAVRVSRGLLRGRPGDRRRRPAAVARRCSWRPRSP